MSKLFEDAKAIHSAWPHAGGCEACRDAMLCNYCGAGLVGDRGRCTNGRCSTCHQNVCTPGDAHGYGRTITTKHRLDETPCPMRARPGGTCAKGCAAGTCDAGMLP